MKSSRNTITATIVLILTLTIAATIVSLPAVTAQNTRTTYAFIGAIPNPVGVGQEALLHVGITDLSAWEQGGWTGITVTVTKPDGTTDTLGPFTTSLEGGTGTVYVPTIVGTYTLQTHVPEQVLTAEVRDWPAGTVMLASSSEKLELIVQEEPVPIYPGQPLPTEYWTRPIDSQLREWASISGNWLEGYRPATESLYRPYNDGPETAHILWARPLTMGGLVGGELGPAGMESGDAYEGKFFARVIINGILYYNLINPDGRGPVAIEGQEVVAVDLRTGEELWSKPLLDRDGVSRSLSFGQSLYWSSFNLHGVYTYLWTTVGSTWNAYDAFSGKWAYTMTGVPSGTNVYGENGNILRYTVDLDEGWMSLWNSTRAVNPQDSGSSDDGSWARYLETVKGRIFDATETGIEWNVTIPKGLPGNVNIFLEDRIIGSNLARHVHLPTAAVFWGISTAPGREGTLLFNTTWTLPADVEYIIPNSLMPSLEDGVFVVGAKETRQWYGFSIDTGKPLWGPTTPEPYLNIYSIAYGRAMLGSSEIAYGKLITTGYAGEVNAYNIKTGEHLWTYEARDPYKEILWSNNWPIGIAMITDGKIYLIHGEHSEIDPKPRGAPFICLDVETGEEIWRANGLFRSGFWGGRPVIGDSIIAICDLYDQRIYAVGKGPSQTTVEAPLTAVPLGSSVVIRGMVTDVSAGTKEYALTARFPSGVPAIADEYMSEWMLHVYKQFPLPMGATGVKVKLTAIDPNGNYQEIGEVTADLNGNFGRMWQPPVPGEYHITATFEGSESYWSSDATTYIGVTEAPSPAQPIEPEPTTPEPTTPEPTEPEPTTPEPTTPEPTEPEPTEPEPTTPEPTEAAEAPLITTEVAIIAAVIIASIIGVVSFWALRKRK